MIREVSRSVASPAGKSVAGSLMYDGPSLSLDFALNEYRMGAIGSEPQARTFGDLITFNRASGGGRFNAEGVYEWVGPGVQRFDHDPVTDAPLGILIEEQRTNLLLRSSEFNDSYWTKTGSTVSANAELAPDGTMTADKIVESISTGVHLASASFKTTATTYTSSAYVKPAGRNLFSFRTNNGNMPSAEFDMQNITATVIGSTLSAGIEPVGNGWFRCYATRSVSESSEIFSVVIQAAPGSTAYTGDGTSGIYIWGAQLEAGLFATSYIPTEASQVTRAADVCSVNTLSPWYNASEGSLFVSAVPTTLSSDKVLFDLSNNTAANRSRAILINGGAGVGAYLDVGGVRQASIIIGGSYLASSTSKVALSHSANNYSGSFNGNLAVSDLDNSVFTATNLAIGRTYSGAGFLNGHIKSLHYYPRRLSNSELQELTV